MALMTVAMSGGETWAATDYAPGEVIVVYQDGSVGTSGVSGDARSRVGALGTRVEQALPANAQLLTITDGDSVGQTIDELKADPRVRDAFPNYRIHGTALPSESDFYRQWAFANTGQNTGSVTGANDADINAPAAWDMTTGSPDGVVAVVDSGIDSSHPDLVGATWRNPGESGGGREANGIDDDQDGLVDDYRGWDYVEGDNNPADAHGHGTHVSGIIAGRPNNGGIVGLDWQTRILPLRVLDASNYGYYSWWASAFDLAGRLGVRVVNASLAGTDPADWINTIIASHPDTLYVVSAANEGVNVDSSFRAPCALPAPNVLCVAATTATDGRASFSNYGPTTVDMGAPGELIYSSLAGGTFGAWSGTSMAAPMVTGTASLMLSLAPRLPTSLLKWNLMSTGRPLAALAGLTASGKRLDAAAAVATVYPPRPPVLRPGGDPVVMGTPRIGEELTADEGRWDGGTPLDYTRMWERCDAGGTDCVPITGTWAYTVSAADSGHRLRFTATVANYWGSRTATSAVTPLIMGAPTNRALPVVSGSGQLGATLTASAGTWDSVAPPTLTTRWERCTSGQSGCTTIASGTSSYTTQAADLGRTVRAVVSAQNAGGTNEAASNAVLITSAPVAPPASGGSPGGGSVAGGSGRTAVPATPAPAAPASDPAAAVSGGASSPTLTPAPPVTLPVPITAPADVTDARLTSPSRLKVSAAVAVAVTGPLEVRLTVRVHGRSVVVRGRATVKHGRASTLLTIPKALRGVVRREGGQIAIVGTPVGGHRRTLGRSTLLGA